MPTSPLNSRLSVTDQCFLKQNLLLVLTRLLWFLRVTYTFFYQIHFSSLYFWWLSLQKNPRFIPICQDQHNYWLLWVLKSPFPLNHLPIRLKLDRDWESKDYNNNNQPPSKDSLAESVSNTIFVFKWATRLFLSQ